MKLIVPDCEVPINNSLIDDLLKNELNRNQVDNGKILPHRKVYNHNDDKTQLEKEIIAIDALTVKHISQTELARIHNTTQSSVSDYKNGEDSKGNIIPELKASNDRLKKSIIETATQKLMDSLEIFTPTALEQNELPNAIAKMAGVVEKLNGGSNKDMSNGRGNVHLHFYAPNQKMENEYETIDV